MRWRVRDVGLAFSAIADGDMHHPAARAAWLARHGRAPVSVLRQVHGTAIVTAGSADRGEGDGMVASDPAATLLVFGADCPGVAVIAPDALGLAHCGWRGTAAGMATRLVAAVAGLSRHPVATFAAFIGPGIAGDDYEVDAPVLGARAWPAEAVRPGREGHAWLDVGRALDADLRAAGIAEIVAAGVHTSRDPRLWSYRARGAGLVQALAAWREPR